MWSWRGDVARFVEGVSRHWWGGRMSLVNDVIERMWGEGAVWFGKGLWSFLFLRIRSCRMRTKPRAHTAIVNSCVILVRHGTLLATQLWSIKGFVGGDWYHRAIMLDFLKWDATIIALTVYLGITTLVLLLAQDGASARQGSSSMTVTLIFDVLASNLGSSGGCWWFFGILRDCAIGLGKECIHCGGQMQKAIALVKEAISLAPHDLLAIALVCITLAHGTNHRRQRNTSGS